MPIETERAQVLITVKATPQPSGKYGETVCVAGIRLDTPTPSWIRLYPIAFRYLVDNAQFKKYDIVEVDVQRRHRDSRAESYMPVEGSWETVGHLDTWRARHEVLGKMSPTTTCALARAAAADPRAPSLGMVHPREVHGLKFDLHEPWTAEQIQKMEARIAQEHATLFPAGPIPKKLIVPRFKVRYHYRCAETDCTSHVGRILDWELTALQNRYLRERDERLREVITAKYQTMMFDPKRDTGLIMGNFEAGPRRAKFSVLGVYHPERHDVLNASAPKLF